MIMPVHQSSLHQLYQSYLFFKSIILERKVGSLFVLKIVISSEEAYSRILYIEVYEYSIDIIASIVSLLLSQSKMPIRVGSRIFPTSQLFKPI